MNVRMLVAAMIANAACIGSPGPLGPSAVILPDAAVVHVGDAQTFTVEYASVRGFGISAMAREWTECARIDAAYRAENSIRLIAVGPCDGFVFVSADLGPGRSPLVAVMAIR